MTFCIIVQLRTSDYPYIYIDIQLSGEILYTLAVLYELSELRERSRNKQQRLPALRHVV